jgi:SAM-dependent methyltransferase
VPAVDLAALPHSEACERNREPILALLRVAFAGRRRVLEIGSGTGQHAVHFAAAMPWLRWQPTERAPLIQGLAARVALQGTPNLLPPAELDVLDPAWPRPLAPDDRGWDAAFTANTLHIMSRSEVEQFFVGVDLALEAQALLAVYGPFRYAGRYTSESNARFDEMLRTRDPASGIRDAEWIDALAAARGFVLVADHAMPANNQLRLWRREPAGDAEP